MGLCEKCLYYTEDWEYDDKIGDDIQIFSCAKGMNKYLEPLYDGLVKCPCFEEYVVIQKPYKEPEPTKCDTCYFRDACNNTLEITTYEDSKRHFIRGNGYCQEEQDAIMDKALSWLVENRETMGIYKANAETLRDIIRVVGDMTFREMIINREKIALELQKEGKTQNGN